MKTKDEGIKNIIMQSNRMTAKLIYVPKNLRKYLKTILTPSGTRLDI